MHARTVRYDDRFAGATGAMSTKRRNRVVSVQILVWIDFIVSGRCLWVRRSTWPSRWDGSATNSILLLTINVMMMTPPIGLWVSPYLHDVFGVWNLEELFGHICYLGSLMGLIAMGALRLKMTDDERQMFMKRHIELAGAFIVPIAVALFVLGDGGGDNIGDLVMGEHHLMMYPYWTFMGASSIYLSVILIRVLKLLREDPRSRAICNVYIAGCYLSLSTTALGAVMLIDPIGAMPVWLSVRLELFMFAIAATLSWTRRVGRMRLARDAERERGGEPLAA